MVHNKYLAYDSNINTGCVLIRNPADFVGVTCVNQV